MSGTTVAFSRPAPVWDALDSDAEDAMAQFAGEASEQSEAIGAVQRKKDRPARRTAIARCEKLLRTSSAGTSFGALSVLNPPPLFAHVCNQCSALLLTLASLVQA